MTPDSPPQLLVRAGHERRGRTRTAGATGTRHGAWCCSAPATARAVALEDRCVHRPYPLSRGWLDGDTIVSGYSGFAYDADGVCVRVPTQDEIPVGARVRAFPVHDDGAFVWAWLGDPALAALRPPAALPWLTRPRLDDHRRRMGDRRRPGPAARELRRHHPRRRGRPVHRSAGAAQLAPAAGGGGHRDHGVVLPTYPPAPVAGWHAELAGLAADSEHIQRERGAFVSPGVWVDSWDVDVNTGEPRVLTFRFTHAVTPDHGRPHPARLARQPQLRARRAGQQRPAADLHRLLPAGAVDPGDHAVGAGHRRPAP